MSSSALDSPVRHRTGPVDGPVLDLFQIWHIRLLLPWADWRTGHCLMHTGHSGAPADRWSSPRVAWRLRGRPLALATVGSPNSPVHHRIVRWIIATLPPLLFPRATSSLWMTHHSPVHHRTVRWIIVVRRRRIPRAAYLAETGLAHQTLSGAPPGSPVCQTELDFGYTQPSLLQFFSFLLCPVSNT
jgi:hypothetical protein